MDEEETASAASVELDADDQVLAPSPSHSIATISSKAAETRLEDQGPEGEGAESPGPEAVIAAWEEEEVQENDTKGER